MEASIKGPHFFVIDLPVRLTATEIERLNIAVAQSGNRRPDASVARPDRLADPVDIARDIVKFRRRREALLGSDLFTDPGWDLLLDLFIAEASPRHLTASGACLGTVAPATTALRHLKTLEKRGLVVRHASSDDRRVSYVRLTQAAVDTLSELLSGW